MKSIVALAALAALCACAPRYLHSERAPDAALPPASTVAVLPVTAAEANRPPAERAGVAESYRTGQIAPGAEATVTDLLYQALEQQTTFEPAARPLVEQELARAGEPPSSSEALQKLARAVGAEAALHGVVTDYREREGSRVGVERPATVGIELWLVRARDGQTIWHGRYYEAQQSLTEELRTLPLYLKRGTRWLTAEELAAYAVQELVKTFPRPEADSPASPPDVR
ncbi:MAG: hypothetical protein AB1515_08305 [Nitrospirota bacterium]